jgi:hypothetical protein
MKASSHFFFALFATIFIAAACTKNGVLNAPDGQIAANKTKVKINEPDLFALVGADSTKAVNWSVTPVGYDTLQTQRNGARIVFTKPGNYTVSASQTDSIHASIAITVVDSVWVKPAYSTPFGGDEQITMVPQYFKSTKSDSSYIAFTASTKKAYCTNMAMDYGIYYASHDQAYYIQFNGTLLNAPDCGIGSSILTVHNNFSSYLPALLNGTYPLHIFFNGKNHNL